MTTQIDLFADIPDEITLIWHKDILEVTINRRLERNQLASIARDVEKVNGVQSCSGTSDNQLDVTFCSNSATVLETVRRAVKRTIEAHRDFAVSLPPQMNLFAGIETIQPVLPDWRDFDNLPF